MLFFECLYERLRPRFDRRSFVVPVACLSAASLKLRENMGDVARVVGEEALEQTEEV